MSVFLTGATGLVGRYLLRGFLDQGEDVVALVRGATPERAERRIRAALAWFGAAGPHSGRVRACTGSLEEPGLGLSRADRELVIAECDSFVHCAASVRFDLPLEEARRLNVYGTRELLELAAERRDGAGLSRVDYLSTAYVAGRRTDVALETEIDGRLGHRNSYEQTKFEAESMVRRAQAELPIAIFRPSIVVGESEAGRTPTFKVIYWPIKVYAMGLWRTAPGRRDASLDLIPIDILRDAILAIRRKPESIGGCFHLASGVKGQSTLGELARVVQEFFPERKTVRFFDPKWWPRLVDPFLIRAPSASLRTVAEGLRSYIPYLTSNPQFDTARTRPYLESAGIVVPEVSAYFQRLVRYCVESDFGRRDPLGSAE